MNPINFYPVKYFVEISEADLTGTINLVNIEHRSQNPETMKPELRTQNL
jgi:hypothetical protein